MLSSINITNLRKLGKTFKIKGYTKMEKQELQQALESKILIIGAYGEAAMSLYGLIKLQELLELYISGEEEITLDQLESALSLFVEQNAEFRIYEDYLVSVAFEANEFKDVDKFAEMVYAKPRYMPSIEEFLKYALPGYFENTVQITALREYLIKELNQSEIEAEAIVKEIHALSSMQSSAQQLVDVFNNRKLLTKEEQIHAVVKLVTDVSNNTRLIINNGHTLDELGQGRESIVKRDIPAVSTKVQRNEPCPCGSGKKYKKCCGK